MFTTEGGQGGGETSWGQLSADLPALTKDHVPEAVLQPENTPPSPLPSKKGPRSLQLPSPGGKHAQLIPGSPGIAHFCLTPNTSTRCFCVTFSHFQSPALAIVAAGPMMHSFSRGGRRNISPVFTLIVYCAYTTAFSHPCVVVHGAALVGTRMRERSAPSLPPLLSGM